jgi:hypothetical protein
VSNQTINLIRVKTDLCRFRWAICQLDILRRLKSIDAIKEAINKLPKTLNETYEQVFSMISDEDRHLVRRTLGLMSGCNVIDQTIGRPMPANLLIYLLKEPWTKSRNPHRIEFCDYETIADCCGCLVTLQTLEFENSYYKSGETGCSLAHFTVQEFLSSDMLHGSSNENISRFAIDLKEAKQMYAAAFLQGIIYYQDSQNYDPKSKLYNSLLSSYKYILAEISSSLPSIPSPSNNLPWFQESIQIKTALLKIMDPQGETYDIVYRSRDSRPLDFEGLHVVFGIMRSPDEAQAGLFCQLLLAGCHSWACEILEAGDKKALLEQTNIYAKFRRIDPGPYGGSSKTIRFEGTAIELYRTLKKISKQLERWPTFEVLLKQWRVGTVGLNFYNELPVEKLTTGEEERLISIRAGECVIGSLSGTAGPDLEFTI